MDYVTVRALREKSGEIWQRIEAGEEFVITRNGKPFALLVHTEPQAVAAHLRALRLSRLAELVQTIRSDAQADGVQPLTEAEMHAEIDAARRERHARQAASVPPAASPPPLTAGPWPKRHARRR